jgi:hypothetical protein
MREYRRFVPKVAADHQQRIELIDRGDRETPEAGRRGVIGLVAEICLP